jgi:hypothetical protein
MAHRHDLVLFSARFLQVLHFRSDCTLKLGTVELGDNERT